MKSQNDTTPEHQLKEVEVSSTVNTYSNESALNLSTISVSQMRANGAFNISDALTAIPGINQVSTGVAISKPVIRGLYGNRIQTVFQDYDLITNNGKTNMVWELPTLELTE